VKSSQIQFESRHPVRCAVLYSDAAEAAERALRGDVDKHDDDDVDESCCVDGNPFKRLDRTQLVSQPVSSSVRYTTHTVHTNLETWKTWHCLGIL